MNCWEYIKCGREQHGENVEELGVCPAYEAEEYNSVNNGLNGGRFCWAIAGTICGGKIQGTAAEKHHSCLTCDFYLSVKEQEGENFILMNFSEKDENVWASVLRKFSKSISSSK